MNFQPLKDYLDFYVPMFGIPGTDTRVFRNHEEIFNYQSGYDSLRYRTPVRDNALYNMYSITKVSTCVAATQLIERGEILITDPLYAYFPEYKDMTVKVEREDGGFDIVPARRPILIKDLLTMTAGFTYNLSYPSILRVKEETDGRCPTLDVIRAMASEPLCFQPGERYQYSLCLDVIGGLIELVSGMRFGDYMRENVFLPLGMNNTSFVMTPEKESRMATQYKYDLNTKSVTEIPSSQNDYVFGTEYESAGAGIISCASDHILLADALTHYGVGKNGERILSKFGVDLMRTNSLDECQLKSFHEYFPQFVGYGYGFGVRTHIDKTASGSISPIGEFGWDGAKMCFISSDPSTGISIFFATHMNGFNKVVHPRLRNLVYSCIGE